MSYYRGSGRLPREGLMRSWPSETNQLEHSAQLLTSGMCKGYGTGKDTVHLSKKESQYGIEW